MNKSSENVQVADNQQERLIPAWITGFTDGEGCFHIQLNPNPKLKLGYQVLPEFRLTQHSRDENLLKRIQQFFSLGVVRRNSRHVLEYRVRGNSDLVKLCTFFETNKLQTRKRKDFEKFYKVVKLISKGLVETDIKIIQNIKNSMNRKSQY